MHLQARPHSLARILLNGVMVHDDTEAAREPASFGNGRAAIAMKPTMVAARHKPGRAFALNTNGERGAWGKWNDTR